MADGHPAPGKYTLKQALAFHRFSSMRRDREVARLGYMTRSAVYAEDKVFNKMATEMLETDGR